jgi:hypothetical protein
MAVAKRPAKKVAAKKAVVAGVSKKFSKFNLRIRSRHGTADDLRKAVLLPVRCVYRHGSTTPLPEDVRYEINTINSIETASSKFKMKTAFQKAGVKTAAWFFLSGKTLKQVVGVTGRDTLQYQDIARDKIPFPLVAKLNYGSRGRGMFKLDNLQQFDDFIKKHYSSRYYFEQFHNYNREYRLHVDANGCFYSCRKMLKEGTPDDKKFFRNDSNCVWVTQYVANKRGEAFLNFTNQLKPDFDQPVNWKEVEVECVKALKAVGLDVGAVDLRIQSSKDGKGNMRKAPEFIIVEINSAPSFGEITIEMYKNRLPSIVKTKYSV